MQKSLLNKVFVMEGNDSAHISMVRARASINTLHEHQQASSFARINYPATLNKRECKLFMGRKKAGVLSHFRCTTAKLIDELWKYTVPKLETGNRPLLPCLCI